MMSSDSKLVAYSKNIFAGTCGGISVCLVGHPFDTIKVRLQTQPISSPIYKGMMDCFAKTIKWEGFGGLYKGVESPLIGQMFFRAALFTTYYQMTDYYMSSKKDKSRLETSEYFKSGAVTGFIASFVECPVDLIKSKMQYLIIQQKLGNYQGPVFNNVFQCGSYIIKNFGFTTLYQGLSATLLRNIPANAAYFGTFEYMKGYFTPAGKSVKDLPPSLFLLSAAIGGACYWTATFNFDVIKSAMMADDFDKSKRKYNGLFDCISKLYYNEGGYARFWKGFTPCILRALVANAVLLYTVDRVRYLLA